MSSCVFFSYFSHTFNIPDLLIYSCTVLVTDCVIEYYHTCFCKKLYDWLFSAFMIHTFLRDHVIGYFQQSISEACICNGLCNWLFQAVYFRKFDASICKEQWNKLSPAINFRNYDVCICKEQCNWLLSPFHDL